MKSKPALLCNECKFSEPAPMYRNHFFQCHHPKVVNTDFIALATGGGVRCMVERSHSWLSPCGRKGKLYEPKEQGK